MLEIEREKMWNEREDLERKKSVGRHMKTDSRERET
jgi:hypothetical protein